MVDGIPLSPTTTLLAVARAWELTLNEAFKPLGLTSRRYGMLAHIRSAPGISFSELARRSGISVQSVHVTVAGFIASGLVDDRSVQSGAAAHLSISTDGEKLLARAADVMSAVDDKFFSNAPDLAGALREHAMRWASRERRPGEPGGG
ncbi:MAG: MarR family transcriptional regulator [Rhodococcus sp. (in: high G+C Gram-positive bacteria)]